MYDYIDEMFKILNTTNSTYPPYDIVDNEDGTWAMNFAVAGFSQDDLAVELDGNVLVVSGQSPPKEGKFIHKGIGSRRFCEKFRLPRSVEVGMVNLADGILRITLQTNEEKVDKKRIPILS